MTLPSDEGKKRWRGRIHVRVYSHQGSLRVASRSGELSANQLPVCLSNKPRPHKRFLVTESTPESTIPGAIKRVRFLRPPAV